MKKIWVVEELDFDGDWVPTANVELSRKGARQTMFELEFLNPLVEYHVQKYVREEKEESVPW